MMLWNKHQGSNEVKPKNKTFSIIIGIIIIMLICVFALVIHKSKLDKLKDIIINQGDIQQAREIFESMDKKEKAINMFEELIADSIEKYNNSGDAIYYEVAIDIIETIMKIYSDNKIGDQYEFLISLKASKDNYSYAKEYELKGEYKNAICAYDSVIEQDFLYNDAVEKRQQLYEVYKKDTFALVDINVQEGDFLKALESLIDIYCIDTNIESAFVYDLVEAINTGIINDYDIKNKIVEVCDMAVKEYQNRADILEQQGEYLLAADYIILALNFVSENQEYYIQEKERLYDKYFHQVVEQAEAVCINVATDYIYALEILEPIYNQYPNEAVIAETYQYYLSFIPLSLCDTEPDEKSVWFPNVERNIVDNKGNVYEQGYKMGGIYLGDADWYLYGSYDTLTGVVAPGKNNVSSAPKAEVIIYGDGVILWEKANISQADEPYNFTVNISGVNDLKIYMSGGSAPFEVLSIIVADLEVQRTTK